MKQKENSLFTKEISRLNMDVFVASHTWLEQGWGWKTDKPAFTRVYGILEGIGAITMGNKIIPMEPGNIYILPTGANFSYVCNTAMEKVYFHINLLAYSHYDMFQHMTTCAVLCNRLEEIKRVATWLEQGDAYAAIRTKNWLYEVVTEGVQAAQVDFGPIEEYSPVVKQAIHYVESNRRSGLTAAEIAGALYVSEGRLQKLFRREVGVPLGRYVNDRLFYYAEQQLRLTDHTIKTISEQLGFCDPFYFSRMFTARYGVSPKRYRKRLMP